MRECARTAQLSVKNVTKSYGTRTVLDQVSFTVRPGERAAVIGENGSGKSTLLRLLAAAEAPDTGEITVSFPGGTGHLAQTLALEPERTVQDAVDLALAELRDMERRLRGAEEGLGGASQQELDAYGGLLIAYEERGGYEADVRVDAALHGLGLAGITRERVLGSLSGGEQSRLALACVLAAAPELLLLDEPTNHLDAAAVHWLGEHLRAHRGTVVAVTHDRGFLEGIATTILEVDRDARKVHRYGDGWAGYRAAKASARRRAEQEHADWVQEVARTEELVEAAGKRLATTGRDPGEGFGKHRRSHEAKLGGQVRAARERLAQLRRNPVAPPPKPFAAGRPGPPQEHAEQLLALGLFREEDLHIPVAALSAGQQRRLQIARLVTRPADLLVLDEPTNHLALDLIEDLEAALAAYPGAVVAVSHDSGFRDRFPAERLELSGGRRH
ncbi:ATP-binding cassette domain-containing protein [Streptomyces sp. NPDC051183]|uniref:ATP-binding cassette domain-containing protein n=1 Tax=Streptomyces sp. NPDC051183 TaxID=3155165 RepID=UPI00342CD4C7